MAPSCQPAQNRIPEHGESHVFTVALPVQQPWLENKDKNFKKFYTAGCSIVDQDPVGSGTFSPGTTGSESETKWNDKSKKSKKKVYNWDDNTLENKQRRF